MTLLVRIGKLGVFYRSASGSLAALDAIDMDIHDGECVAVIGESGSGKSTLALALAGLLPRSATVSGTMLWPSLGRTPRNGPDIGFVFQDPSGSLDPVMTVGRQVAEVVETHLGADRASARRMAADLFARVGLPSPDLLVDAYPHELSGGQKQRVAIAAAIGARPRLLIADEPTSALDTIVQAAIVALLRQLARDTGMALLLITHDIALASGIADRIVVLRAGRIVESGVTRDIVSRPAQAYTKQLLAACLTLDRSRGTAS